MTRPWQREKDEATVGGNRGPIVPGILELLEAVTCRLEPIDNPFGPKLLPMSPE